MDTPTISDAPSLRQGLMQILECYAAAGLVRFKTQPANSGNTAVLAPLMGAQGHTTASRQASAQPKAEPAIVASAAQSVIESPTTPAATTPAMTPPATARPAPAAAELAMPVTPGTWQLPNMADALRVSKLDELDVQVKACRKCPELVCYRRQTVFGEGHIRPRVCFFGEAPGADEDTQGRPFVGPAGKLLTDIIRAMKLTREEVYILNSLKCRPPQNRTPLPEEVDNCRPYALTQLEILQPEFIILLGAVAVRSVLQSTDSVGRLRGRFHHFHGARVLVTYHPAYLLRNPDAKKLVWQDVQLVMRELGLA